MLLLSPSQQFKIFFFSFTVLYHKYAFLFSTMLPSIFWDQNKKKEIKERKKWKQTRNKEKKPKKNVNKKKKNIHAKKSVSMVKKGS